MKALRSLGLDLSTAATGIVVLTCARGEKPKAVHAIVVKPSKDWSAYKKQCEIRAHVTVALSDFKPDIVVLEGYGFNFKHPGSIAPLAELGGIIRFTLLVNGYGFFDPRPGQLKSFIGPASPKMIKEFKAKVGACKKPEILAKLDQAWGFTSQDDNIGDAYVAALMGLANANLLAGLSMHQLEIIGEMHRINS